MHVQHYFNSTTQYNIKKTIRFILAVSAKHWEICYATTSITIKHAVYKLHIEQSWATVYKEYCQNRAQKKPAGKKIQ